MLLRNGDVALSAFPPGYQNGIAANGGLCPKFRFTNPDDARSLDAPTPILPLLVREAQIDCASSGYSQGYR